MAMSLSILSERQRLAIEAKMDGLTYRAIGDRLGISGKSAFCLVKRAFARFR